MLFQVKAWGTWTSFWVRLIALHDIYLILNDWIILGYTIYLLCTLHNLLPIVWALILTFAFQLLVRDRLETTYERGRRAGVMTADNGPKRLQSIAQPNV